MKIVFTKVLSLEDLFLIVSGPMLVGFCYINAVTQSSLIHIIYIYSLFSFFSLSDESKTVYETLLISSQEVSYA